MLSSLESGQGQGQNEAATAGLPEPVLDGFSRGSPGEPGELITVRRLCKIYDISPSTWARLQRAGAGPPTFKIGPRMFIRADDAQDRRPVPFRPRRPVPGRRPPKPCTRPAQPLLVWSPPRPAPRPPPRPCLCHGRYGRPLIDCRRVRECVAAGLVPDPRRGFR